MARLRITATYTDNSGFYSLLILVLSNGAPAPADADEAEDWFDAGAGSNNVVGTGAAYSVISGREAVVTVNNLDIDTPYDVYPLARDGSGNLALGAKIDVVTTLGELNNLPLNRLRFQPFLRRRGARNPVQQRRNPFRVALRRLRRLTRIGRRRPR